MKNNYFSCTNFDRHHSNLSEETIYDKLLESFSQAFTVQIEMNTIQHNEISHTMSPKIELKSLPKIGLLWFKNREACHYQD